MYPLQIADSEILKVRDLKCIKLSTRKTRYVFNLICFFYFLPDMIVLFFFFIIALLLMTIEYQC